MISNMFLINAPAGSGKTTYIREEIIKYSSTYPKRYILCITYTNRAVDELSRGVSSKFIEIKTIHKFIHDTIKSFFKHPKIVELYFSCYSKAILERIANKEGDNGIMEANQRYIDKYGSLDLETLKKNITEIYYNELSYTSLYYGGLSHDDLLSFASIAFKKFTILRRKISSKYSLVFVDEYQDTSHYLLRIIYDAFLNTRTKVYFLGDRMQRIYKNYDYSFEDYFQDMDQSISLTTNFRSNPKIVSLLNKLYNDSEYIQKSSNSTKYDSLYRPRIIIADDIDCKVSKYELEQPEATKLYLPNSRKFESIGSGNLYKAVLNMEEYKYGRKYTPSEILSLPFDLNPDPLFKLLFIVLELVKLYEQNNLGFVLKIVKKYPTIFLQTSPVFQSSNIKSMSSKIFQEIRQILTNNDATIGDIMENITEKGLLTDNFNEYLSVHENLESIYQINLQELVSIDLLNSEKNVSTQHGVKGESHDSVFFIVEDNSRLGINMYALLELLSKEQINLNIIEDFYLKYSSKISNFEKIHIEISKLRKQTYEKLNYEFATLHSEIINEFGENPIFEFLYENSFSQYSSKPNVTNAKKCFNINPTINILNAYKLFYVGCSRARRNLTVFVERSKISNFNTLFSEKFNEIGFEVVES